MSLSAGAAGSLTVIANRACARTNCVCLTSAPPTTASVGAAVAAFVAKYRDAAAEVSQQTGIPTERILAQAGFRPAGTPTPPT
jgi:flagellum-specific peptidoglycan hydrolase FlgJ